MSVKQKPTSPGDRDIPIDLLIPTQPGNFSTRITLTRKGPRNLKHLPEMVKYVREGGVFNKEAIKKHQKEAHPNLE